MIYVSQGHENGVGIEIFIKSIISLGNESSSQYILVINQRNLEDNLKLMNISYKISEDYLIIYNHKIQCHFFENKKGTPNSTLSLDYCLKNLSSQDILLTLPTSKDQLVFNGNKVNGHTEYLRKYYNKESLTMNFISKDTNVLLITDHISINDVTTKITSDYICEKVTESLENIKNIRSIKDVYFAGIDPHCGEDGQISDFDNIFPKVKLELSKKYTDIDFHGPYAADTIHFNTYGNDKNLIVYPYHDQGLAPFKLQNGIVGINLTLGLDYKRVSVDHGTAFDLYGKNKANYLGMLYLLEEINSWT